MCLSSPNYVGHCIVKFLAAGWREETWLRGSATMKRARNNRWRKREYRRETYEVDLPPHCVRRRVSKTKSCHVGRHQRHRPGLAIPLVVGPLFQSTGNEGRTAGYPLFSFTYAPRRETPRWRVCETDVTAAVRCGCVSIDATADVCVAGGYGVRCIDVHDTRRTRSRVE